MVIFANISLKTALSLLLLAMTAGAQAQGYYYPPQPGYYPQYQPAPQQHPYYQQQRQQVPQQRQQEQPAQTPRPAKKKKDISGQTPPDTDIRAITGSLVPYTWDFSDTFADLAKASNVSTNQILALNRLSIGQLRDGQVLKVPAFSTTSIENLDIKRSTQKQMAREVWRGIRGKNRVALTFDAGGEPDGLDVLLKGLAQNNAAATFFVTGQFATDHPDLVGQIFAGGFPIHNHSWSHPKFTEISDEKIGLELSKTDDAITSITGQSTKPFWRPPFGERDDRVLETAVAEGYRSIYWTHDSLDSVGDKKSADFVANRVLFPPRSKANPDHFLDGAIILMHVGEMGTANAVPEIISGLRERGFTLVTVEEILQP